MTLDQEAAHRRKSSLVASDYPVRPKTPRKLTSCYVHQLLEKHRGGDGTATPPAPPSISISGTNAAQKQDKDPEAKDATQHTESRLLTKKQLSEMALGIRELSKKLAHLQLKLRVRNIFLLTKAHDRTLIRYTRTLVAWLLSDDIGYNAYVENTMQHHEDFDAQGLLQDNPGFAGRLKYWDIALCQRKPHAFDIVVAVRPLPISKWLVANIA